MGFDFSLFWYMLLAHLIYDWHIQGITVGVMKGRSWVVMHIHCMTWAMILVTIMWWCGQNLISCGVSYFFFHVTHYFVDLWKCRLPKEDLWKPYALLTDQGLHLLPILFVCIK